MSLTRVPIYHPVNQSHRAVNLTLIADKDWFIQYVTEAARSGTEVMTLNRRINACEVILETLKEMSHVEAEGASTA